MKSRVFSGLAMCFLSWTLHAADDREVWEKINAAFGLATEAFNRAQHLQQEVEELKSEIHPHHIGELYQGGIIFYVDETKQHGLIASHKDINLQGIQWRNGSSGNKVTNARSDGIAAGETNTRIIIAQQTIDNQKGDFAALQASNFKISADGITPCKTPLNPDAVCYGGWYLPSAYELMLLHRNLHETQLSSFAPEFYWSSTEADVGNAWLINFSSGQLVANSKSSTLGRVRPIRQF
ncbi:TPA: DUF1566 domain-containing protein [Legionella pneumophila]